MKSKLFFDIHCHAMDLSHPNLLAFIKRLPWRAILLLSPILMFLGGKKLERVSNLLSIMENDIGGIFLIMEFYLKHDAQIQNDLLTNYDTIVLTPLLIDFDYKNIRTETYYKIPPEKPIVDQTIDVFNGIKKYCFNELVQISSEDYDIQPRKNKPIFEIYPFLGINTRYYELGKIDKMLDKYFGTYAGSEESYKALQTNLGKFDGNIDNLGSNFFAGIKVYPPIGFDPWPEDNGQQQKVNKLYQYCCDKNIPITTHCSDGGFILDKNAEAYTSPARWQKVLERYPTLKINFAHFGYQGNTLFFFPNLKWQREIVKLMQNYRKVYTDFSYRAFRDDYYKSLIEVVGSNQRLLERTLFGTDFMINLLSIDSYNEYLKIYRTTKNLGDEEKERFCSTNPWNFLFV